MNQAQRLGELLLRIDTLEEQLRGQGITVDEDPLIKKLGEQLQMEIAARRALESSHQEALPAAQRTIDDLKQRLAEAEDQVAMLKARPAPLTPAAAVGAPVAVPAVPVFTDLTVIKPGSFAPTRIYAFLDASDKPMSVPEIGEALRITQRNVLRAVRVMTRSNLLKRTGTHRSYRYELNREAA